MKYFSHLISLAVLLHTALSGRNDGEPDYDPDDLMMNLRDGGRNDGEPDYDPEIFTFAPSMEVRDDGRNDGEPDYDGSDDFVHEHPYRMLIPDKFRDCICGESCNDSNGVSGVCQEDGKTCTSNVPAPMCHEEGPEELSRRSFGGDDFSRNGYGGDIAIDLPDSVWDREKNATRNRGESRFGRQSNPPSSACLNIRVIYNQGWINSAAGGNSALGLQRAREVVAEAEMIYKTRYAAANRLGTDITFNVVGGAPSFGSGSWQATSSSLQSSAVQNNVGNSLDIHHYAFLAGRDGTGAIGIAYVGTPCFRLSNDQRYKISINEWYNNVADSAGVLAHEIGHALGMYHDFGQTTSDIKYDSNGNRCTGLNGLMDYGSRSSVDKFTTCSKEDFTTWYRRVMNTYGSFCLTCGNVVPTIPPTVAPSCNGVPATDWSCCSSTNQCNTGEGDCDVDSDCAGSLTCGSNNCRATGVTGSNWSSSADCCEDRSATVAPGLCDGIPSTDWSCCSSSNRCGVGEGDCDSDSDCATGLQCGANNCDRDFSTTGSNWNSQADCCVAPSTVPTTTPGPTVAPNCDGIPTTDWSCCSSSNQCNVNEGDCDIDSDCAGTLVCGTNNCRATGLPGSSWSSSADCCIASSTGTPPAGQCNGVPITDWSCCSSTSPCDVGGGDCDRDSDCSGSMTCGTNNCQRDFSSSGSNWSSAADCCIAISTATTTTTTPAPTVAPNCNGIPMTDWSCCTTTNQCNVNEGDCDDDSECAGTLVCGTNNCRATGITGSNWYSSADCCVAPSTAPTTTPAPTVAPNCDGIPTTDWNCCGFSKACNVNEGDCDTDSDCAGSLVCGTNNCQATGLPGSNWASSADCCVAPAPTVPTTPGPTAQPPASCGIKPSSIVGGGEVTPYSLPWQVGLVRRGSDRPFCGGMLITERHVLTAAHCTSGTIDVMVGEHRITSGSDGTRHTTCRYVDHPSYNRPSRLNNDFAILHLNKPVTLGTRANPVCLPPTSMNDAFLGGKTLTVSGWGALTEGGGSPTVLYAVDVPGMTNSRCNQDYPGDITSAMLCAGQPSGGIDACQGDSGGPLTYTTGGKTYAVGVVSWGLGCARPGKAGVYSRVTEALPFIQQQMAQTC